MVKKIVHVSDIHIRTFKRHDEYLDICNDFFKSVKEDLTPYNKEECRIVIVGDLVHQKITISNEQIQMVAWFLRECSKICKTIIIAGNHDLLENNKERLDSLTPIITLLANDDIQYLTKSGCYIDDDIVWCNYSIFEEHKRPDIESCRIENKGKTFIGLLHAPVIGSTTNLGYEFEHGIEPDIFDGCDIVMLGDIHKRQKIKHKIANIQYCGSLIQQDFGESINKHGYLLWDIPTKDFVERDISSEYGFYKFKINCLEDIKESKEVLVNI